MSEQAIIKIETGFIYAIKSKNTDKYYIDKVVANDKRTTGKSFIKKQLPYILDKYRIYDPKYKSTYKKHFEIIKHGDVYLELLDEIKFTDSKDLRNRHGELVKANIDNVINTIIYGIDKKERIKINIEHNIDGINDIIHECVNCHKKYKYARGLNNHYSYHYQCHDKRNKLRYPNEPFEQD